MQELSTTPVLTRNSAAGSTFQPSSQLPPPQEKRYCGDSSHGEVASPAVMFSCVSKVPMVEKATQLPQRP